MRHFRDSFTGENSARQEKRKTSEAMPITDEDLDNFLEREEIDGKSARDAERVARIFRAFYAELEDMDEVTRQQVTLAYARKILKQSG